MALVIDIDEAERRASASRNLLPRQQIGIVFTDGQENLVPSVDVLNRPCRCYEVDGLG